jgi:hypothetical protein
VALGQGDVGEAEEDEGELEEAPLGVVGAGGLGAAGPLAGLEEHGAVGEDEGLADLWVVGEQVDAGADPVGGGAGAGDEQVQDLEAVLGEGGAGA